MNGEVIIENSELWWAGFGESGRFITTLYWNPPRNLVFLCGFTGAGSRTLLLRSFNINSHDQLTTNTMSLRAVVPALLIACLAAGCTTDPEFPEKSVQVAVTNLPPLDDQANYHLWFSYPEDRANNAGAPFDKAQHGDKEYLSIGAFRVAADGSLVSAAGSGAAAFAIPDGYNPNLIEDAILTVENADATPTTPGSRVIGGVFTGTATVARCTLTVQSNDAFGAIIQLDSTVLRTYFLDAPTSLPIDDFMQGIWFGAVNGTAVRPGLSLSPQPLNSQNKRWTYESWLVQRQGATVDSYISLGRFDNIDTPDSTGPGAGAGPTPAEAYSIPGEDFVAASAQRTLNDGSYRVVVSLQPTDVPLRRPLLTLLQTSGPIPTTAARYQSLPLSVNTTFPTMQVTVNR